MRNDYTHISIVLDRSGSMDEVKKDTIGGFNTFLKDQKEGVGKCTFSMVQFDTEYEVLYTFKDVTDISELNEKTFLPRGCTALLDALGKCITTTGQELSNMKESDRPGKVIFVIITDGEENSSREYTREKILEMIKHQEEKYNWRFIYLGANQDAIQVGAGLGVASTNSLSFAANSRGIGAVYNTVSMKLKSFRSMDNATYSSASTFTPEDVKEQEDIINENC